MRELGVAVAIGLIAWGCGFDPSVDPGERSDEDADAAPAPGSDDSGANNAADAGTSSGVLLRFNMGGPEFTGADFPGTWAADPGTVCNGGQYMLSVDVVGTQDDPLFLSWQYSFSQIDCAIGQKLAAGDYELTLLFGEIWIGPGCPYTDERIFDIYVEGQLVEAGLDTVEVGGCCHPDAISPGAPFTRVFNSSVADGTLDLILDAQPSAQAMVSAIQLRKL